MFGTFATAGKEVFASAAVGGQCIALLYTEPEEFRLALQVTQVLLADVAEAVFGIYEVVAHIHIAIVLHHQPVATCRAE